MEYYSSVKNNGIMKFAGKWMELEKIILCEVTRPLKQTWYVLTYKWIFAIKYRILVLHSTDPKNLNKK